MATSTSVPAGRINDIHALGQSVWFDNIRRALLASGEFERMVRADGLSGLTSNPSIFEKAIVGSTDYDAALAEARCSSASDVKSVYEGLAIADLRAAADVLRGVYESTYASDGYVSMEVSPDLAHDTAGTVAEARRLWASVDRPNLMIKVPGTDQGIPAIRALIGAGINVNITLLFSTVVYERVVEAYLTGLEDLLADGGDVSRIASVASFFVSRIDSAIDPRVSRRVQGKVGIAKNDLCPLSDAVWRYALGDAARPRCPRAKGAVGIDEHQERRLPRAVVRRVADRARHGGHDSAGDL